MKRTPRTFLAAAAISGLISGTALQNSRADATNTAPGQVAPAQKSPKVQSCAGQNDCKAIGGCKTEAHSCKVKNACKGQGGCEITQKDIKAWQKAHPPSTQDPAKAAPKPPSQ